jgi:hypothetical protein
MCSMMRPRRAAVAASRVVRREWTLTCECVTRETREESGVLYCSCGAPLYPTRQITDREMPEVP